MPQGSLHGLLNATVGGQETEEQRGGAEDTLAHGGRGRRRLSGGRDITTLS